MVKFQNIISRKSKPPFQKQLFADVLQSRCSKTLRNIRRKTPALESLFNSWSSSGLLSCEYCNIFKDRFFHKTCPVAIQASDLIHVLKLITCYTRKTLQKILDMLQVVNKETQSLLLTFNRFHILF